MRSARREDLPNTEPTLLGCSRLQRKSEILNQYRFPPLRAELLACLCAACVADGCKREALRDTDPRSERATAASLRSGAAAAVKYTCPMHADVLSDEPGRCPHCKMDLVAVQNTAPRNAP